MLNEKGRRKLFVTPGSESRGPFQKMFACIDSGIKSHKRVHSIDHNGGVKRRCTHTSVWTFFGVSY